MNRGKIGSTIALLTCVLLFATARVSPQDFSGSGALVSGRVSFQAKERTAGAASSQLSPATTTPAWSFLRYLGSIGVGLQRFGHSAVFDPNSDRMIVFAGDEGDPLTDSKNDVWVLANANGLGGTPQWTHVFENGAAGSPPAREYHTAVYDAANNRMIVFGGYSPTAFFNDVWVLADANDQSGTPAWTQLSPTGGPPAARGLHQAVYDPGSNSMTIFGGVDSGGTQLSDVWVLRHANGLGGTPTWTQLSPTGGPPPANGSSAIYDPASNVMTVFGGSSNPTTFTATNGAWALSNANGLGKHASRWIELTANGAPGSPPKRAFATAVYDAGSNRMIVFGGGTFTTNLTEKTFNDVWVLSSANSVGGTPAWTKLSPAAPLPTVRSQTTAVFDAANNRMIVFGGIGYEGIYYSVWVLSDANGQ